MYRRKKFKEKSFYTESIKGGHFYLLNSIVLSYKLDFVSFLVNEYKLGDEFNRDLIIFYGSFFVDVFGDDWICWFNFCGCCMSIEMELKC